MVSTAGFQVFSHQDLISFVLELVNPLIPAFIPRIKISFLNWDEIGFIILMRGG
ncbi:MAG: hypothetical protein ACTSVI_01120 [Promethearchaeota archaeon]